MRSFLASILFLTAADCSGAPRADYAAYRKTIEEADRANKTPILERIFVLQGGGLVMRFRKGITLRDIVDQTSRKGRSVQILVLRESKKEPVFFERNVKPEDKPAFTINPHDVIVLEDPFTPDA